MTEEYLYDPEILQTINDFADKIGDRLRAFQSDQPSDHLEVFLELSPDGPSYYIVDHMCRCIVWLEKRDIAWVADQVSGVESIAQFSEHLHFLNAHSE